jgi:hypothetical protein
MTTKKGVNWNGLGVNREVLSGKLLSFECCLTKFFTLYSTKKEAQDYWSYVSLS